jgi:Tol biopolymer transport system component
MKVLSSQLRLCFKLSLIALFLAAPILKAQPSAAHAGAGPSEQHLRSRVFVYDLRDGSSHLVFTADSIWEAPNWSPDGKYLIANSGGGIYKLVLNPNDRKQGGTKPDGTKAKDTAEPQRLAVPANFQCNNDKAVSPDGKKIAFSATVPPHKGSQVFLADADGSNIKLMASESPSYFHGWSPDNKTLAFVAQRNGSGQYDIYGMPADGGAEKQLTSNIHHDDGPDYSPDGKWIYINSDRSGKEAVWRFPSDGAGTNDTKAEMVVSDGLEDWFPHISPDGKKMVYIGYPANTPTHNPRNVQIELKLAAINDGKVGDGKVAGSQKTLVKAIGGQGTMNVNSWAPDSARFAYVVYEDLP